MISRFDGKATRIRCSASEGFRREIIEWMENDAPMAFLAGLWRCF